MPDPTVEEYGVTGGDADGDDTGGIRFTVFRNLDPVLEMAAGNDMEISAVGLRAIGEEVGDLERDAGTGLRFQIAIKPCAVLVPAKALAGLAGRDGRRDDNVRVIELDMPA